MRTLLTGGVVVTCDEEHTIHAPGDLVIEDERILFAGQTYHGSYDARIPCDGKLLMPGLINAHTHSPMSLFRGLADDVDLRVFLNERVWPREIALTEEEAYGGAVLSAVEMLKRGVTTCADMYFFEDALARAALDTGIRALITPGILQTPAWEARLGGWERRTADVLAWCARWEGAEGRIHTGLGPHAPYTLPLSALVEIAREAAVAGLPVHIHLVETREESDAFAAQGRGSTIAALNELGVFAARTIAAHVVWPDAGDLEILAAAGAGVAHCPQSNAKLGAGMAPLAAMLEAGLNAGLGTDGAATNNNLDLWEELRLAPLLAKATACDPAVVSARDALWMATRRGALAIHRPELGVLAEGYAADVLALDVEDTAMTPIFEPATWIGHLVYAGDRALVDAVWVHGRQVVRDGEVLTVDEAAVRRAAQEAALAVSARV